ncbi:MAG TPA: flagellin, partial [Bacillota bacterium]|nr:flagellin [Bacillota bacterium]
TGRSAGAVATLQFGNGAGNNAFSFTLETTSTYDTSSTSTMSTLAADLTDALKLSATGGVDGQAATYGVYAHLTGAESVKLEAGMSSITFSNGIKINFNELTTSDVNTSIGTAIINELTMSDTFVVNANTADNGATATIDLSEIVTAEQVALGEGTIYSVTINGKTYSYTQQASDANVADIMNGLKAQYDADPLTVDNIGSSKLTTSSFTFNASINGTSIELVSNEVSATAGDLDAGDLSVSASSFRYTYNYVNTFGDVPSTFDVVNKAGAGLTFQVGANEGDELTINIDKMDANYLGVASAKVTTQKAASAAISAVDKAINRVSSQRAYLGAIQNRLEYKINNLEISTENLTSAESQIRDVDMAKEMTNFTNANILQQAATAMLAQANALPQNVLSLIGG